MVSDVRLFAPSCGRSVAVRLLAAAAAVVPGCSWLAGGITSEYTRPAASRPLSHEEAAQILAGRSRRAVAADIGARRLQEDLVEQVAIGFHGPGELVVTYAAREASVESVVLYGVEGQALTEEARGTVSAYAGQICPSNIPATNDPPMGSASVTDADLAKLLDTSAAFPVGSPSYAKPSGSEAWSKLDAQGCIHFTNPQAWYQSPYIHTVVLRGLAPRTKYVYKVGGSDRVFRFVMPPAAGQSDCAAPLRIGIWADIDITNVSLAVMAHLQSSSLDAAILVGDYCYADGYLPKYDMCGKLMEPLFSSVPHLGVVGNHEMDPEQALPWYFRHPMPFRASGSPTPLFHSYDLGLVHVLSISGSYAPTDWDSAQYRFVADDLARVSRTKTPWLVVQFHVPWYSSGDKHFEEGYKHRQDMELLLHTHGVDIVLSGHLHAYERSHPVFEGQANPCGITYIVIGDGGNVEGPALPWREPQPGWSAFREASFGSGVLTVHNSSHAEFEWRRSACVTRTGKTKYNQSHYTFTTENAADTQHCSSGDDNSEQSFMPVDSVSIVRDTMLCVSRTSGGGAGLASKPTVPTTPTSIVGAERRLQGRGPATPRLVRASASAGDEALRRAASVTSRFKRPLPPSTLTHQQVLERLRPWREVGVAAAAVAGKSRRLQDTSTGVGRTAVDQDPVEQVHLGLAGSGEVVVTYLSKLPALQTKVWYGVVGSMMNETAVGEVSSYVMILCPTCKFLRSPARGDTPLSSEELAAIVDTSSVVPPSSASYRHVSAADEAWDLLRKKCVHYANPKAYHQAPYIHTVTLQGLLPRTRYAFQPEGSSRLFTFATPPLAGQSDSLKPLRIGVWSDVGATDISIATAKQLEQSQPDLLMLAGDLSYADGWTSLWETFGTISEPLMSSIPSLTVPGDHEAAEGKAQNMDWLYRYPTPFRESASPSATYYSYDVGLVHVVGLNSYAPVGEGSPQRLWLEQDLQSVDREKSPWVVVMFHVPWYSSNAAHIDEGYFARQQLERIFLSHGVDVVFTGHVHAYERTHPVFDASRSSFGPVHIRLGDAGNYEGPAEPWQEPQPEWSAFRESSFGSGLLTVHNSTHALWEWRRSGCAIKDTGNADSFKMSTGETDCQTAGDNGQRSPIDSVMLVKRCADGFLGSEYGMEASGVALRWYWIFLLSLLVSPAGAGVVWFVWRKHKQLQLPETSESDVE